MEYNNESVQTGTFHYQRRSAVKTTNLILLLIALAVTFVVNQLVHNSLVSIAVFLGALVLLAILTVPVMQKQFYRQGSYEFTPDRLTFRTDKELVIDRSQVKFTRCAPLKEKHGNPDRTWCLQINTAGVKGEIYKLYSVDKDPSDKRTAEKVDEFIAMAKLICDDMED